MFKIFFLVSSEYKMYMEQKVYILEGQWITNTPLLELGCLPFNCLFKHWKAYSSVPTHSLNN